MKNDPIKVIVAGGRTFTDTIKARTYLDHFLQHYKNITIVSGGARGADALGEQWAKERGHTLLVMKAEWDVYGKSAGYKRNEQMAQVADGLIAFWDGQSRGTKHMIDIARKQFTAKNTKVVLYKQT